MKFGKEKQFWKTVRGLLKSRNLRDYSASIGAKKTYVVLTFSDGVRRRIAVQDIDSITFHKDGVCFVEHGGRTVRIDPRGKPQVTAFIAMLRRGY